MPDVICNTSPIQYLYQVNLLHILKELYGHIAIPEGVCAELDAGRMTGIALPEVKSLSWLSVSFVRERTLLYRFAFKARPLGGHKALPYEA